MIIDTSDEAVERLVAHNAANGRLETAATLRALLTERGMWRDEKDKKQTACEQMGARIGALEAERDRAAEARTKAIKIMSEMSRQAGSWQGIAEGKSIVIHQLEVDLVEARRDALEEAANLAGQTSASRFVTSKTCQSDRARKHMHIRADEAGQIAAAIRALKEKGDD
jgi:hypothetical protein